jgi:hypothetical protein
MEWDSNPGDHHRILLILRRELEEKLHRKKWTRIDLKCAPTSASSCNHGCIFSGGRHHYVLRILESESLIIKPSDEILFHSLYTSRRSGGYNILLERKLGDGQFDRLTRGFSGQGITQVFNSPYFPTKISFRISICGDLTMQELARTPIMIYIIHND